MANNAIIKAMIMKLSGNNDEMEYKNGFKYDRKHKWWDVADLKSKNIPVAINYKLIGDNIIGYVKDLKVDDMDNVYATMVIDDEDGDPDMKARLRSSVFLAGVTSIQVEESELRKGKIHSIGVVNKKYYPFRRAGLCEWKEIERTKLSAKPGKKFAIKNPVARV